MPDRPRIGLDFDDTLMPTREIMVALLNAQFGTNVRHNDCTEIHFTERWNYGRAEFREFFSRNEIQIHTQPPYDHMTQTLSQWAPHADFYVITGRPEIWKASAANWLLSYNIPFVDIICTDATPGGKSAAAQKLALSLFIDDRADFAADVASTGIPTLLPDRPYNQSFAHPLVTRVQNWRDIQKHVAHHALLENPHQRIPAPPQPLSPGNGRSKESSTPIPDLSTLGADPKTNFTTESQRHRGRTGMEGEGQ